MPLLDELQPELRDSLENTLTRLLLQCNSVAKVLKYDDVSAMTLAAYLNVGAREAERTNEAIARDEAKRQQRKAVRLALAQSAAQPPVHVDEAEALALLDIQIERH